MTRLIVSVALIFAACAGGGAAGAASMRPAAFLAQLRCPSGTLEAAEPGCRGAAPQKLGDVMRMRRHDWPGVGAPPEGWQAGDSLDAGGGRFVSVYSYAPWGRMAAGRGDGGEILVVDGDAVRIAATQDGGRPGVLQGFTGAACGGTGWVAWRTDAPSGRWAELVARLADVPQPGPCRADNQAFTRYRLEAVTLPFLIDGRHLRRTLRTVISDHFDGGTIAASKALERTYFAEGVGRAVWEAYTRKGPTVDLTGRCPGTSFRDVPAGFILSDCRYLTNLVRHRRAITGAAYGWPPSGVRLP